MKATIVWKFLLFFLWWSIPGLIQWSGVRTCDRVWEVATLASFLPCSALQGPQWSLVMNSSVGGTISLWHSGDTPESSLWILAHYGCMFGVLLSCVWPHNSLELPFKWHWSPILLVFSSMQADLYVCILTYNYKVTLLKQIENKTFLMRPILHFFLFLNSSRNIVFFYTWLFDGVSFILKKKKSPCLLLGQECWSGATLPGPDIPFAVYDFNSLP